MLFIVAWDNGEDWTEDFAFHDLGVRLGVGDQREGVVGAGSVE